MCTNASRAESVGPHILSDAFCGYMKCLKCKFSECRVQQHVGMPRTVEVHCREGEKNAVTQALALTLFVKGVEKTPRGQWLQQRKNARWKADIGSIASWTSRTKIHKSSCTALSGSRKTATLRRCIVCAAFAEALFDRIKRRKF